MTDQPKILPLGQELIYSNSFSFQFNMILWKNFSTTLLFSSIVRINYLFFDYLIYINVNIKFRHE